eukprot:440990_1
MAVTFIIYFTFIYYIQHCNGFYHKSSNALLPYNEFQKIKQSNNTCPCNNESYCNNIQIKHSKELFGFGQSSNISMYNWTYLTTIAWANTSSSELMCTAHQHNVRLIATVYDYPLTNNKTIRMQWIQQTFEQVIYYHFDGITFDYESPMLFNEISSQQYVDLINETTIYFHSQMPGSQISVCVAWQSYLTDGRQYSYYNLSLVSDLLYIMDYAIQSQNYQSQCLAAANAPYPATQRGIKSYLNLQIDRNKLILGVPWYGFNYSCNMNEMESMESKYCPIYFDPFRGMNCSDAVGKVLTFANINKLIDLEINITEIRWDNNTKSPYFNMKMEQNMNGNQVYQIWYDDVNSLAMKYQYAKSNKLRGVGPFEFSQLYDTFSDVEQQRAKQMWSALDVFFK